MKRSTPRWLEVPTFLALRTVFSALGATDIGLTTGAAALLGRGFAEMRLNRKRLHRAIDNLAVAFPDWPLERRREYAVRSYEHLLMLAAETIYAPRVLTDDGWPSHLSLQSLTRPLQHMLNGRTHGTPTVTITGHCGNWEVLGYSLALLGFPLHALYRPLDLAPFDRWVRATRQRRGLVLVDKFGATEMLPSVLRSGGAVGFVADQNAGDRGLFVPFFGRLASTYKTIGLLAIQHHAPVICGVARRLTPGLHGMHAPATPHRAGTDASNDAVGCSPKSRAPLRYTIEVVDIIEPQDWVDRPDPLFYVTARYRRAIETAVRLAPEQYLWMHRYWKSRPRHERLGRPFPSALREKLEQLPWMTQGELDTIMDWSRRDAAEIAVEPPRPIPEPEPAGAA
ncbi:MAG: lysophospholipid acyltransferase family protein [Phycisphaeraceae bacterium]|nr:lysophospholipid acyltransferase family protein [Phycisphaeraceae bacterium]